MDTEQIFYKLGQIFLAISIIIFAILFFTDFEVISRLPGCAFFERTGVYCPGCGGTRAVICLIRGDVIRSFMFHPFVLYFAFTYTIFMVYEFCKKHFKLLKKAFPVEILIYIGIGILILQWIVKVILQFVL